MRVCPFTDLHLEVVEGMLVDVLHLLPQPHGVVGQGQDVGAALPVIGGVVEARGGHVGGADGLDLLQLPEPLLTDDLGRRERTSTGPCLHPAVPVIRQKTLWPPVSAFQCETSDKRCATEEQYERFDNLLEWRLSLQPSFAGKDEDRTLEKMEPRTLSRVWNTSATSLSSPTNAQMRSCIILPV